MQDKPDNVERLFNLLEAMRYQPIDVAGIYQTIQPYWVDGVSYYYDLTDTQRAGFHRMFERDKSTLINLGVRIRLDSQTGTYRANLAEAIMPELELSAPEFAAVRTALQNVSGEARALADRALTKLGSAYDFGYDLIPGAASWQTVSKQVTLAAQAIEERLAIEFEYHSISSPTRMRTVQPWRLLEAESRWYILGFCLTAQAPRYFAFARIASLRVLGAEAEFVPPAPIPEIPLQVPAPRRALIEVPSELQSHFPNATVQAKPGEYVRLEVSYQNEAGLLSSLWKIGAVAKLIGPEDLVTRAHQSLSAWASQAAGADLAQSAQSATAEEA